MRYNFNHSTGRGQRLLLFCVAAFVCTAMLLSSFGCNGGGLQLPNSDMIDVSGRATASPALDPSPTQGYALPESSQAPDATAVPPASPLLPDGTADPAQSDTTRDPFVIPSEQAASFFEFPATFLGVDGYGEVDASLVMAPGAKVFRFLVDGEEKLYSIRNDDAFSIQNQLMEGYKYLVSTDGDEVLAVQFIDAEALYTPVVPYTAGERTLKNFLSAALAPLGTTLYVYGGSWNWQDDAAACQATTIGIPGSWVDFYNQQTADYVYKNDDARAESYYPFGGWNEYYYAGADCSGYLGWVLYNTFETESGNAGYVYKSTELAKTLAEKYGFGTWSDARLEQGGEPLCPGDIISLTGHVWVCLGRCDDGSIVVLHSSPSESSSGRLGGGVQLSALNPSGSGTDCEAYELACSYTEKYFPNWAARYPVVVKPYSSYIDFERTGTTGFFRWRLSGQQGLSDPDGFAHFSAAEVLAALFGEK